MNKRKCKKSQLKMKQTNNRKIKYLDNTKGITLIALVISIIVMLILAGVSLNATIGENGIMTQAKNATYVQSVAVLEEYINNYYVEHYEELSGEESKVLTLTKLEPSWFYIPANEGVGGLRYVVDGEGHALYLIKKSGLPDDIKNQIRGGDAGEGSYADYVALNDVYGVTSDLKVYYCSNGTDTILGASKEAIDSDNPLRKVYTETDNSAIYGLLSDYDTENSEGNKDGVLTAEELKSVTKLTINSSSGITDFSSFYNLISLKELTLDGLTLRNLNGIENCSQLNYIFFKSSVIGNYSSLTKLSKLKYLYLFNIDDTELEKLCGDIKDANFSNLEYLAIVGNESCMSNVKTTSYYVSKSAKVISSVLPLEQLADTTKKSIKYLSLNNNNLESLEAIKDFTNVILLRCEGNQLINLNGLENMNNLTYLCGGSNKLGTIKKDNDTEESENVETGISIKSLANKKMLQEINLNNNPNLTNVSYLNTDTNLKYLYLENCSKNMNVNVISNILDLCSPNYKIPVKYLTGNVYNVKQYYTPSQVTYEELYSDLYGNTTITHLNLEGCTKLTNEQLNNILKSMPQLRFVTLKDNTTLTTLDFVAESKKIENADGTNSYNYENPKCINLVELDLRNTNITDMTALNEYATKLRTLRVSKGECLKNIVATISRLKAGSTTHYWYGKEGSMSGLNVSNLETLKVLEEMTDLNHLEIAQWSDLIGDRTTVLNLKGTKLSSVVIRGIVANVYYPDTVTSIFNGDGGIPILAENSEELTQLEILYPVGDMSLKNEMFNSLKNAKNLKILGFNRTMYLKVTDLSEYLKDELPSIETLRLSGSSGNIGYRQNIIKTLNGIEKFPNLKDIKLNWTDEILDISAIKNCTKLTSINIQNARVQSISGIENLKDLRVLNLNSNSISGLKPLENLQNLEYLDLSNNAITDNSNYIDSDGSIKTYNNLEILANLNKNGKLKKLYLSGNDNIINWSPLSSLKWDEKSGW